MMKIDVPTRGAIMRSPIIGTTPRRLVGTINISNERYIKSHRNSTSYGVKMSSMIGIGIILLSREDFFSLS
jgi:hypothetical protein